MVSEAGASVYSASDVAREEFPDLDVTVRGAISIARRLQDPLAELVKIDPKSIGVGQYQHDVSQTGLKKSLDAVVESCVNQVGVDLNTASRHLLAHVSGIGPALAQRIVEHRAKDRAVRVARRAARGAALLGARCSSRRRASCACPGGANPLDNTGVHPERYARARAAGGAASASRPRALLGAGVKQVKEARALRDEVGAFTFDDIVARAGEAGPRSARRVRAVRVPRRHPRARGSAARAWSAPASSPT